MMDSQAQTRTTIAELNQLYNEAETADKSLFAEQRSNVLLAAGDHFTKKHSQYWAQFRDNVQLNEEVKLRITKNHIHRIMSIYSSNIYGLAPGVAIFPKDEKELHDVKVAEQHTKVWKDIKQRQNYKSKVKTLCDDFMKVGEICWKIFFDPNAGDFVGYEAKTKTNELTGEMELELDEAGAPIASDRPVFTGAVVIEKFDAFNVLRSPNSKEMMDGAIILRKMVDIKDLHIQYKDDEAKMKMIQPSSKDVFKVFNSSTGTYEDVKGQCMVREYYYPVCEQYPMGYFFITTEHGILEEGELPFGIFPIVFDGFDSITTSPRKRSLIKQLRPVQAELNRAASMMATQQVTLGDDKLLVQSGTTITPAAKLPGVRAMNYVGAAPTILQGRSGEQYLPYIEAQQREMYVIANLQEELEEKPVGQTDPLAELYKVARHKKKYSIYASTIEDFLVRAAEICLKLAKHYYTDEMLMKILGAQEMDNFVEFRSEENLGFEIRVEPQSDDVEERMGKQITLTQIVQYMGNKLEKDDIGRILRAMPYTNKEEMFQDFLVDYDNVTNDILALDRGELPHLNIEEDHKYAIKKLTHRMKQPDFKHLHPHIQNNYMAFRKQHEELEMKQIQLIKQAQAEFIPSGGYLVTCDFYISDPAEPGKTKRAKIPYESMAWLINQLEKQGTVLSELERLQQGAVADMASSMIERRMMPNAPSDRFAPQPM